MSLNSETDLQEGLARFEENRKALCRFNPALAALLSLNDEAKATKRLNAVPEEYSVRFTKEGLPLLSVRGFQLQSRYNPEREAARALDDPAAGFSAAGCIFAGLGLGYYCLEYAKRFPAALLAIIEPDVNVFLLCMKHKDLVPLFANGKAIFLIALSPSECVAAIGELQEKAGFKLPLFSPPALSKANSEWFAAFHEELRRRSEKREINLNTLKRFGSLWLKNIAKNRSEMKARQGIVRFKGVLQGFPALLLAAGPTLDNVLPLLKALREKCVVIAADTALRACLREGVQPDFLVLVDPQYWNYRHVAGLSCPGTFLITESAAWPAVFRLECRDIFLCSSLFPIGKFIEERTEKKGALGAGGSVATTAWDFARYIGAGHIYAAGLDLGYPKGKTHFRGALFEEEAHASSSRLNTAEQASVAALFSAGAFMTESALGGAVLTDKRLNLYAWWFENAFSSAEVKTILLSAEGVKIAGAGLASAESLKALPDRRAQIDALLGKIEAEAAAEKEGDAQRAAERAFEKVEDELLQGLKEILALAEKGEALCERRLNVAQSKTQVEPQALKELGRINKAITAHPVKDILAMAFTEDESQFAAQDGKNANASFLLNSLLFYRKIAEAARANLSVFGREQG